MSGLEGIIEDKGDDSQYSNPLSSNHEDLPFNSSKTGILKKKFKGVSSKLLKDQILREKVKADIKVDIEYEEQVSEQAEDQEATPHLPIRQTNKPKRQVVIDTQNP